MLLHDRGRSEETRSGLGRWREPQCGISPVENLRWYDRVLRAVGVLILGMLLAFGLFSWLGWVR